MLSIPEAVAIVTLFSGLFLAWRGTRAAKDVTPMPSAADDVIGDLFEIARRSDERLIEINAEVRGHTRTLDRIETNVNAIRR